MEGDEGQMIELAKRELASLDERISKLVAQRAGIAHYLAAAGVDVVAAPAGANSVTVHDARAPQPPQLFSSRRANAKIIDEAIEIVLKHGRPMTAPQILPEHSHAHLMTPETLYRLVYNRVISGSLYSLAGAFWPIDKPIPQGWDLSQAKRAQRRPFKVRAKA